MKRPLVVSVVLGAVALGLSVAAVGWAAAGNEEPPTDYPPIVVESTDAPSPSPSPSPSPKRTTNAERDDDDDDDGFSRVNPRPRSIDDDDDDDDGGGDDDGGDD